MQGKQDGGLTVHLRKYFRHARARDQRERGLVAEVILDALCIHLRAIQVGSEFVGDARKRLIFHYLAHARSRG